MAKEKSGGDCIRRPIGRKTDESKYKLYPKKTLITELLKEGISRRKIAKICKVDRNTLCRFINTFCWNNRSDYVRTHTVVSAFSSSDSWSILSEIEKSIKAKIEAVGMPLKDWDIQINYGIKTGCNDAFIIDSIKRNEILDNCTTEGGTTKTAEIIRPILRGRDVCRYGYEWGDLWLINTHNGIKGKLEKDTY